VIIGARLYPVKKLTLVENLSLAALASIPTPQMITQSSL
jgi:hypothetical protein